MVGVSIILVDRVFECGGTYLPAGVGDLAASLANCKLLVLHLAVMQHVHTIERDDFSHFDCMSMN